MASGAGAAFHGLDLKNMLTLRPLSASFGLLWPFRISHKFMGKSSVNGGFNGKIIYAMFDCRVCCSCCEGKADRYLSCMLAGYSPQVHMNPWSLLLRLLNDT